MGFADSPATRNALSNYGVRVSGYRWQWGLGLKGGTYPPHYDLNNQYGSDSDAFGAAPGLDVNGDSCTCRTIPIYRTADGRFAKPNDLVPVFSPPQP